ncbi:MAG: TonB-dependent receptor [Vicinamibacterales bacterium]
MKGSFYYREDVHNEAQVSRPTNAAARTSEPNQEQAQYTWSVAVENTWHATPAIDLVAGASYDSYAITKAEEYNATRGLFQYPLGGSDAPNGQAALIWRQRESSQFHVSVSDRARFPVIFELYSTRFGTATPNPNLGSRARHERRVRLERTRARHSTRGCRVREPHPRSRFRRWSSPTRRRRRRTSATDGSAGSSSQWMRPSRRR